LLSSGRLLKLSSVCLAHFAFAGSAYAVTYNAQVQTGLGTLSWPNPHHYKNFIASGEYCTSTHFVCERPDFEIQTASISDVANLGDFPLADTVGRRTSSISRPPQRPCTSTAGDNAARAVASSNPNESQTGTIASSKVSFTTTYVGELNDFPGTLSWPNPHKYKNFIASGEYCTSTHFTCERPDSNIQTASISDEVVTEDLPLADADPAATRPNSASRASQEECNGNTARANAARIVPSSNPGDSPTGTFNGGGTGNTIVPVDPKTPTPSPVPLPASVWFLLAGISGLGVYRRSALRSGNQH
jgi:hypothetical protein